jgi:membrane peptidoglycan carboxypeptidase
MEMWKRGDFSRGASTITAAGEEPLPVAVAQSVAQVARAADHAAARRRVDQRRISKSYALNVVEWGDGVCGADAAARTYFHVPRVGLSAEQAGAARRLADHPRRYSPGRRRDACGGVRSICGRMRGGGWRARVDRLAPAGERPDSAPAKHRPS